MPLALQQIYNNTPFCEGVGSHHQTSDFHNERIKAHNEADIHVRSFVRVPRAFNTQTPARLAFIIRTGEGIRVNR